jgi:hypothetical protein
MQQQCKFKGRESRVESLSWEAAHGGRRVNLLVDGQKKT